MGNQATDAGGLPRLDVFDQEFGTEPSVTLGERRRGLSWRAIMRFGFAAVIISLPTLAWLNAESLRSTMPSAPMLLQSASRETADEPLSHLIQEIATLRRDLGELNRAHREALERIELLQSDQNSRDLPSLSYWYSDLAALSFESATYARPSALAPPARRSATVRPEARELRRRDSPEPLSLEAPQ